MKIIVGIIKYSTFVLFVGIVAITVASYLDLPVPTKPLVVQTGSMSPSIPAGSLIFVSKAVTDEVGVNYVEGDVVTFEKGSSLVSHRVVTVVREDGQKFFQTQGDANTDPDPELVPESAVVGKVIVSTPFVGRLVAFIKQPVGFLLLVAIPTLFIIFSELFTIFEEIKKTRTKSKHQPNFLKPITLTTMALVFVGSSFSYFSDVAVSTSNTLLAAEDFTNLKINEFVANPGTAFTTEWVEIFNAGSTNVDLTGWFIQDATSATHSLTSLGTISAGGFVVIEITEGFLNNSSPGDSVFLKNPSSEIEDSTSYSSTQTDDISRGRDTNGSGVFKICTTATKGTSNNGSC